MTKAYSIAIFFVIVLVSFVLFMKLKNDVLEKQFSNNIVIPDKLIHNVTKENKVDMKYILLWTSPNSDPFVHMGNGPNGFIEKKCLYTNCIVTANRSYLEDYSKFDVIAFAAPEVFNLDSLPNTRSPHQKYVFVSTESSDNYPVCSNKFDQYFNWSWTYKLDSEVRWSYFAIKDYNTTIIGPNKQMRWLKLQDMDPVSDNFQQQLKTKTKAAAWFVSNCNTRSKREKIIRKIINELENYYVVVDIYDNCKNIQCSSANEENCKVYLYDMETNTYGIVGKLKCSRGINDNCNTLLEESYYFYFTFENSFSEDYVTDELLRALNSNVVPIVFGGANYTRFMPDGIYLNAKEFSVQELAAKMYELMNDLEQYSEYFKWKNHYSYHKQHETVIDTEPYCLFCAHLNNKEIVNKVTVYEDFRKWWDPPGRCIT